MANRWVADKVTDTNSPFYLRRDVLDDIETRVGGGGGATAVITIVFSQAVAEIGTSAAWRVPSITRTIQYVSLAANTGPVGSNLVVAFKKNGTTFQTLTMTAGTTTTQTASVSVSANPGDLIQVTATSVGSGTAATGVAAQLDYT